MPAKKHIETTDTSTEDRIKAAARKVFHQKGFAATRTRDIAEEAGINLALLNYYFRSKQKLFDLVMVETLQSFFASVAESLNDTSLSFDQKIETFVERYLSLLIEQPQIPLFVLGEARHEPDAFIEKVGFKEKLMGSSFIEEFQQKMFRGEIAMMHPLQFLVNIMALVVFPFVASPFLKSAGKFNEEEFNFLMEQRKALIPKWIKAMLSVA